MDSIGAIDAPRKRGGSKKGRRLPPRKDGFGGGSITPQQANAIRWSPDRRTLVAMAQEHRPEAFATVLSIMCDPQVEAPTRLRAGELVLAYADGKPRQSVDVAISGPRDVASLSTVELEAIARGAPPPFQLCHDGHVIDAEFVPVVQKSAIANGASGPAPVAPENGRRRKAREK